MMRALIENVGFLELLIAPPITVAIVAGLTWLVSQNASADFNAIRTASELTPLGALVYLVLQSGVLVMVLGWMAGRKLANDWIAWREAKQEARVKEKLLDDPEFLQEMLERHNIPQPDRRVNGDGSHP